MTTLEHIQERLTEIRPIGSSRNIVDLGLVRRIDLNGGTVLLSLAIPPPLSAQARQVLANDITRALKALDGVDDVQIREESAPRETQAGPSELRPLAGVRDIIAVSSTKGGVGKSTVAANLALAIHRLGRRVGLMDSDVYGPSVPIMFAVGGPPKMSEDKRLMPIEKFGIQLMSVGFFLDENAPVIWRGPMVMGLVRQFLKDVAWENLDVLVVDMPPGTGDAPLTLVQQVPLAGGIIVTTPQDVATLDVERGIAMFQQVNTPVLGIVENLSVYRCPHCGHDEDLFGSGGGHRLARDAGVPLLGQLPLMPEVRACGDEGKPIVVAQPDHAISRLFMEMAQAVLDTVELERSAAQPPAILE